MGQSSAPGASTADWVAKASGPSAGGPPCARVHHASGAEAGRRRQCAQRVRVHHRRELLRQQHTLRDGARRRAVRSRPDGTRGLRRGAPIRIPVPQLVPAGRAKTAPGGVRGARPPIAARGGATRRVLTPSSSTGPLPLGGLSTRIITLNVIQSSQLHGCAGRTRVQPDGGAIGSTLASLALHLLAFFQILTDK